MQQKKEEKSDEIMEFPAMNTTEGLKYLDCHLASRSYISDFEATHNDEIVFKALGREPTEEYCNALRWYRHIQSFGSQQRKDLPKSKIVVKMPLNDACCPTNSGEEVEIRRFNTSLILLHPHTACFNFACSLNQPKD